MKTFKSSYAFIFGSLTFFSISNAYAGGFSYHTEKNAEIEYLSDDKKCIYAKEKEFLHNVEA